MEKLAKKKRKMSAGEKGKRIKRDKRGPEGSPHLPSP